MNPTYSYPVLGGSIRIEAVHSYDKTAAVLTVTRDDEIQRVELSATGARALAAALEAAAVVIEEEL